MNLLKSIITLAITLGVTTAFAGPGDLVSEHETAYYNPTKIVSNLTVEEWAKNGQIVWHVEAIKGDSENVTAYLYPITEGNENPSKISVPKSSITKFEVRSTDNKFHAIALASPMDCTTIKQENFSDKGVVQGIYKTPYGDVLWVSSSTWTYRDAKLFHVKELNYKTDWACK